METFSHAFTAHTVYAGSKLWAFLPNREISRQQGNIAVDAPDSKS
jgi:hypothetical protein